MAWDQNTQHTPVVKIPDYESDEDDFYEELDPMLKKKLLQTRRKSVSFSVCIVDKEKTTFDLDRRHVLLGLATSTDIIAATSSIALPALEESGEAENTDDLTQHLPLVVPLPGEKIFNSIETIV